MKNATGMGCNSQGGSLSKEPTCSAGACLQHRRPGYGPWVRKSPWRRKWPPTPLFSPGKPHGQRSLVGSAPWGHKSWTRLCNQATTTYGDGSPAPLCPGRPRLPPAGSPLPACSCGVARGRCPLGSVFPGGVALPQVLVALNLLGSLKFHGKTWNPYPQRFTYTYVPVHTHTRAHTHTLLPVIL